MMDYSDSFTMEGCRLDNLAIEEKKINAAHNGYMYHTRNFKWFGDGGWHNLRAFLINRVEQVSNYDLVVIWNDDEINPDYKIVDRKKYLKETFGIDWVNRYTSSVPKS